MYRVAIASFVIILAGFNQRLYMIITRGKANQCCPLLRAGTTKYEHDV